MIIKKFRALTLKEATEKMKTELGREAVILSTRVIKADPEIGLDKMFEITAGLDKEVKKTQAKPPAQPQSRPNDFLGELRKISEQFENKKNDNVKRPAPEKKAESLYDIEMKEELKLIRDTLLHREVQKPLVDSILGNLENNISLLNPDNIDDYVISNLSAMIPVTGFEVSKKNKPCKVMFVGPTGVGKTTTITKLATISKAIHELDVGIITLDTYRLGAIDQIRIFADIIGIELLVAYDEEDIAKHLKQFRKKDIVYIDTAGRSQKNTRQLENIKKLTDLIGADKTYLVLSSTNTTKTLYDAADKFSIFNYDALIFTKLDEAAAYGNVVNTLTKFNKPVIYVTNGQTIPDDLVKADADHLAAMIYTGKAI